MEELDVCQDIVIHKDVVEKVKKDMIDEESIYQMSNLFKMFADETRCKILSALAVSEMCVCDLAVLLKVSHSAVSHQLSSLKKTRLVRSKKQGKVVYYSLDDEHITDLLSVALTHINER